MFYNGTEVKNTIDLSNLDSIQTAEDLVEAVQETFNPDLPVSPEFILSTRIKLKGIARDMGCFDEVSALIDEYAAKYKECNYEMQILQNCTLDRTGRPLNTTENYLTIMSLDPAYAGLRYNEMSKRREKLDKDGKIVAWSDEDEAASHTHIESRYGIWTIKKHDDALQCLFKTRGYHPIKQVIEGLVWDGESRIPYLLSKWMGAEDTEYTREVSRLIFAGGIQRLYHPGCKFEDMPVLVGGQGAGKSSFVRFLAIEDRFFTELTTIDSKEGMEGIEGAWIVEVSELLALTKTKEQEAVKAYLSRLVDKYRPAYARYIVERPRTCVFIGTTNRERFITDKTGGRRFYPIQCTNTGYKLFDHEEECREYIKQCWAEAYAKRDTDFMSAYAKREIKQQMEEQQEAASEDDYRVGVIEAFLESYSGDRVCTNMLWELALGIENRPPERADQTQIGLIMQNMKGWVRSDYRYNFGKYGKQRHWKRERVDIPAPTYDTPNDFVPF